MLLARELPALAISHMPDGTIERLAVCLPAFGRLLRWIEESGRNVDSDGISGVAGLFATNRQEVVRARDGLGPGGRRFPVGRLGF